MLSGKELCGKGCERPGRQQVECEAAACPCSSEGQQYPGLYEHSRTKCLSPFTLIRAYLKYCILFQAPKTGKTVINWSEISRGPLACSEGWSTCLVRRSCRHWTYSVWKRDGLGGGRGKGAHSIPQHLQGSDWGVGARLFTAVHSRRMELKRSGSEQR